MNLFTADKWPLLVICLGMIVAAVIDGWKRKVPNWLTFPLILSGWMIGIIHNIASFFELELVGNLLPGQGGFGASFAGTALGFALLLPVLLIGGMGQGDVKMQMGFGAWVGSYFGILEGSGTIRYQGIALWIIFISFCLGVLVGGVIALGMMAVRRSFRENLQNTRQILLDISSLLSGGGTVSKVAEKGDQLRAKEPKLPYGVPLCIGFVGYLVFLYWQP